MPLFTSLIFILITLTEIDGIISNCPQSQEEATHAVCKIFQNTNIETLLPTHDFTVDNYCLLPFANNSFINCTTTAGIINNVDFDESGLNGTLDMSIAWPSSIRHLDLEQLGGDTPALTKLYGNWNWSTLIGLNSLYEFDLENNKFSGKIENDDWIILASLPRLDDLVLAHNNFEVNFTEITFTDNFPDLDNIEMQYNNFYGTMDTSITGFFSHFPDINNIYMYNMNIEGHFDSLDVLSTDYMPELDRFLLAYNQFSGSIGMSDGVAFEDNFYRFDIGHNRFSGTVQWEIFQNLSNLYEIDIEDNQLTGTINWNILTDLVNNGNLGHLELEDNNFTGFADFSFMGTHTMDYFDLDVTIRCDPSVYPCPGSSIPIDRTTTFCKTATECWATCQCSTYAPTNDPTAIPTMNPSISPTTGEPTTENPTINPTTNNQTTTSGPTIVPITSVPTITPITSIPTMTPTIEDIDPETTKANGLVVDEGDDVLFGLNMFNTILIGCIISLICIICWLIIFIFCFKKRSNNEIIKHKLAVSKTQTELVPSTTPGPGTAISPFTPTSIDVLTVPTKIGEDDGTSYIDNTEPLPLTPDSPNNIIPGAGEQATSYGNTYDSNVNNVNKGRKKSSIDEMYKQMPQRTPGVGVDMKRNQPKLNSIAEKNKLPQFDDNWGYDKEDVVDVPDENQNIIDDNNNDWEYYYEE